MHSSLLLSLALALSSAEAVYKGFNYGSTFTDGTAKAYDDFKEEFTTAQNLVGTSGFTSGRLYTMIQGGTTDTVISAIQAAIDTKTSLLLGLWASGDTFTNELTALKTAISQYPDLGDLIAGISVGSEDLYRNSATGIENDSDVGANPDTIVSYIKQVREAISGTAWSSAAVGHVDTWDAWTNSSNVDVITNSDWLGVDEYPFFQYTESNSIDNAKSLFSTAYDVTKAAADGKEVWITETGWPISGKTEGSGIASLENAKTYWDQVGCPNFGVVNTWWYTLQDAAPTTPNPSFGIVGSTLTTTPLYDLSCSNVTNSSSTSSSASSTKTSNAGSKSSGSGSASATGSVSTLTPTYSNGTSGSNTTSSGSASGSGSSSSGSSSNSGSSSSTASGSSTSATAFTGSASAVGSSVISIFGAIAAAVLLL